jgi:hypothetical protein
MPNGYGGGLLCIAVRLDGDVARAHGTAGQISETGSLGEPVSQDRSTAALPGYCQSVARHLREQGSHHSSWQGMHGAMASSGRLHEICPGLGLWPVARGPWGLVACEYGYG